MDYLIRIYRLWISLGDFLHKVSSVVIGFVLYFFIITPLSFLIKLFVKNYLDIHYEAVTTYWVTEDTASNLEEQF